MSGLPLMTLNRTILCSMPLQIKRNSTAIQKIRDYHLEGGEVFLPPDVLLVFGSHGRDHVVEIHHDVHKCVEKREESAVATCNEIKR